ncbi:disease resistance protein RUN1-like [Pyrus x bretschneideri]|uniref:disease resistance protein RUN1-like n=1 Tax=Pyrus x bretschneideri TaxID=225117 RepID=UPI00202F14EB|nr:disease resistance protein RUN1-like [Pyrus x bretschneideri]
MELIGFFQVFNIILIAIGTLLYMYCRSLTFSSSTSSSGAADAAVDDNDDDVDMPLLREKYDVFISFRGEDTRKNFTSHLHAALLRKKIETYIDYRLKRGDEIGPTLLEAIEKSRLSVIIFSKNYASSTWCLIELAHILKCKKKNGQMVVPIFYDISPSDVRKQKGSYADAFAELENRFKDGMDKVIEWKAALVEATGLCGSDYSNKKGTDADFIEEVVEDISTKLKRETAYDLKGLVGMTSRIEQVESLLSINDSLDVCTVGIWGMGGIGKTTLARAMFKILSSNFEACCFLYNVREKSEQRDGIDQLQKALLKEILKEENLSIDSTFVRERLSRTKVLIVFDDVTDSRQIKDIAADNLQYGDGSRIIVTSRELSVLLKAVSDKKYIYEVEKLKTDDALRLFQLHAFNDNPPTAEYMELSERVVEYAGGIPLALEILGSLFFPCQSIDECEDVLRKLKNYPNEEIQNTFRLSYNRLGRHEQEIFLDIACFYKGYHIEDVKKMASFGQMHGGLCAADGIRVLRDRSLISINSEWETIDMHDLVQETGRAIVLEQCIEEPGRRSRLFIAEHVYHVLKNDTGTEKVQAIFFNESSIGEQNLDRADFENMYNLRLLNVDNSSLCLKDSMWQNADSSREYCKLNLSLSLPNSLRYLSWKGYPLKTLSPKFSPENLVELHMPDSQVTQLWNGGQNLMNLKVIKLRYSKCLTALPNFLGSPNIEHIDLCGCESLVEIPSYFKDLDKLTYLDLSWCKSLEYLPDMPGNIEILRLRGSGIKELPSSICKLKSLKRLNLTGCTRFYKFPEILEPMEHLEFLRLEGTAVEELPQSVGNLVGLQTLDLGRCKKLKVVPSSIYNLTNLKTLSFNDCWKLQNFPQPTGSVGLLSLEELDLGDSGILQIPEDLICSTSLLSINLNRTKIRSVPSTIKQAPQLSFLFLIECMSLESLPELPVLSLLQADGCKSLMTVSSSMTAITQCWNRYQLLQERLHFYNCGRLGYDADARSSIMVDAQLRIMRVATASSRFKEEKEDYQKFSEPLVTIVCPGCEIPNWFVHQNEGASINVKLPANWFRKGFLGFAVSVVASGHQDQSGEGFLGFAPSVVASGRQDLSGMQFECKYNFKTEEGESHGIDCPVFVPCMGDGSDGCNLESKHVFVLYKDLEYEEGAEWSSDFYCRVTEVSVHFETKPFRYNYTVENCGICLLYAEDAEKLKFDVISRQEQDESAASGSVDPEASGNN